MNVLPQSCEFLKVQSRYAQKPLHVSALGIRGPNGILTICECNIAVRAQINDRLCLAGKAVNVARRMIVE
jgi:hypothetical protein